MYLSHWIVVSCSAFCCVFLPVVIVCVKWRRASDSVLSVSAGLKLLVCIYTRVRREEIQTMRTCCRQRRWQKKLRKVRLSNSVLPAIGGFCALMLIACEVPHAVLSSPSLLLRLMRSRMLWLLSHHVLLRLLIIAPHLLQ